jgi:hypothetical protein
MSGADICVAYLARADEGTAPVNRFAASYAHRDPGVDHRLLVLRRGFRLPGLWEPLQRTFDDFRLRYEVADVPEDNFDLGAYEHALESSGETYLCFLNTFSEILSDGWLRNLHETASSKFAGLVGATGSHESLYDSYSRSMRALTRASGGHPLAVARTWLRLQALRRHHGPFPNPHIRTNGFMLSRTVGKALTWGPYRNKDDVHQSESGRRSLSRQAETMGLTNYVVTRNGQAYSWEDWPGSRTFRSGSQENLMIADNRTRDYILSSPADRRRLQELAWGRDLGVE